MGNDKQYEEWLAWRGTLPVPDPDGAAQYSDPDPSPTAMAAALARAGVTPGMFAEDAPHAPCPHCDDTGVALTTAGRWAACPCGQPPGGLPPCEMCGGAGAVRCGGTPRPCPRCVPAPVVG